MSGSGNPTVRPTPGELQFWDAATGSELGTINTGRDGVSSVAFSPDGSKLAVGMFDGNAKIFEIAVAR